eukprot:352966-Chlamydomonas_euryale.AAC.3
MLIPAGPRIHFRSWPQAGRLCQQGASKKPARSQQEADRKSTPIQNESAHARLIPQLPFTTGLQACLPGSPGMIPVDASGRVGQPGKVRASQTWVHTLPLWVHTAHWTSLLLLCFPLHLQQTASTLCQQCTLNFSAPHLFPSSPPADRVSQRRVPTARPDRPGLGRRVITPPFAGGRPAGRGDCARGALVWKCETVKAQQALGKLLCWEPIPQSERAASVLCGTCTLYRPAGSPRALPVGAEWRYSTSNAMWQLHLVGKVARSTYCFEHAAESVRPR